MSSGHVREPNKELAQYFYNYMEDRLQKEQRQFLVMVQEFSRLNLEDKDLIFSKDQDGGNVWSDRGFNCQGFILVQNLSATDDYFSRIPCHLL